MRVEKLLSSPIGNSTISQWERKGCLGGRDLIPALAESLGVSLDVLLRVRRTKDGRYEKIVPTPEEEDRLQDIGKRKSWDWHPDPGASKGYEAQKPHNKRRNMVGVDPKQKPVKPEIPPPLSPGEVA